MSRRDFTERDIHMALDGELPAEERADFEPWLDANPEMKAMSGRFERDRARLAAALAPAAGRAGPARLDEAGVRARRQAAPPAGTRWRDGRRGGGGLRASAALAAIWSGATGCGRARRLEDRMAEDAIAAHAIYAAERRTRSRSAPTTRTIWSAGCRSGSG